MSPRGSALVWLRPRVAPLSRDVRLVLLGTLDRRSYAASHRQSGLNDRHGPTRLRAADERARSMRSIGRGSPRHVAALWRDSVYEVSGPVAQLVARLVRIEEVRGSNPLRSTKSVSLEQVTL